jgi:hypothetical protein
MRAIVIVAACLSFAGAAQAQDTLKTWSSGNTICGLRRVGSQIRRFVAIDTGNGLTYDFAPSEETWSYELCDRDPNAPPPSFASLMAELNKPRPSCEVQRQSWAKTSLAMRRKITELNARVGGNDCGLVP